ncbi:hypothetical protein ACWDV4_16055 [Micromonospora sp. NPDC003197]
MSKRGHTVATALLLVGTASLAAGTPLPATAAAPARPVVSVAVIPAGTTNPVYRIDVRNSGNSTVDTTVRQELPPGANPSGISNGGQVATPNGQDRGSEVTWQLNLPAGNTTTLTTTLSAPTAGTPVTAPACAYASGGDTPYDCGTATWDAAVMDPGGPSGPAWWQRPALWIGALGVVLVLALAGWLGYRVYQRQLILRRAQSRQRSGVAVYDPYTSRGTLYPRPATPSGRARRRPPTWVAVSLAGAILAGVIAGAVWTATGQVSAIQTDRQPSNGAWVGQTQTGQVGTALRESAFEFTVYRVACPAGSDRCQATVGLRNVSPKEQSWHGALQRAYLPDGEWVTTDEAATRSANEGRDLFAAPVPAGGRLLAPLVFNTSGRAAPTQIELRSAVFSAGVRVDVT